MSAGKDARNSTSSSNYEPEKDPYELLGVAIDASEADIRTAYRKLALKLHPDKQHQAIGKSSRKLDPDQLARDFHDLQQARAFLLEPEFAAARDRYQKKRISQWARRHADAAREKSLSKSRKRMRDDLKRREEEIRHNKREQRGNQAKAQNEADFVEKLRREGRKMRDTYADQDAYETYTTATRQTKEQEKKNIEERQIRMKWSRKKMGTSPSEHSLAELLRKFGEVEQVEMIGSKGNAALVTFAHPDSCKPCVQHYAESEVMRASFVGERKERNDDAQDRSTTATPTLSRDAEKLDDWKLRRAEERERQIRKLKEEDEREGNLKTSLPLESTNSAAPFPPPLPHDERFATADPLQLLEHLESKLLKGLVSDHAIQSLKIA